MFSHSFIVLLFFKHLKVCFCTRIQMLMKDNGAGKCKQSQNAVVNPYPANRTQLRNTETAKWVVLE